MKRGPPRPKSNCEIGGSPLRKQASVQTALGRSRSFCFVRSLRSRSFCFCLRFRSGMAGPQIGRCFVREFEPGCNTTNHVFGSYVRSRCKLVRGPPDATDWFREFGSFVRAAPQQRVLFGSFVRTHCKQHVLFGKPEMQTKRFRAGDMVRAEACVQVLVLDVKGDSR